MHLSMFSLRGRGEADVGHLIKLVLPRVGILTGLKFRPHGRGDLNVQSRRPIETKFVLQLVSEYQLSALSQRFLVENCLDWYFVCSENLANSFMHYRHCYSCVRVEVINMFCSIVFHSNYCQLHSMNLNLNFISHIYIFYARYDSPSLFFIFLRQHASLKAI